ncbi:MAG: isoprenylcysteine carboxylmethyltransferase family protein [Caulobacteraceae bacterium]
MIVLRLFLQTGLWLAAMAFILFLSAGNPAWPAAWAFLIELGALGLAVGLWLNWRDPDLLAERLRWPSQRDQKPWDRRFMIGVGAGFCLWLALMGADVERWRLSLVPTALQGVGMLAIAAAVWVGWQTFMVNSFAAPVVKMQADHRVVDTGPYAIVRHPMYAGAIAFFIGAPLMLGSWLGLAAAPLLIGAMAWRAVGEERMLRAELPGYEAYAAKVRYRFAPRVW